VKGVLVHRGLTAGGVETAIVPRSLEKGDDAHEVSWDLMSEPCGWKPVRESLIPEFPIPDRNARFWYPTTGCRQSPGGVSDTYRKLIEISDNAVVEGELCLS
jgi:hypothetical protein